MTSTQEPQHIAWRRLGSRLFMIDLQESRVVEQGEMSQTVYRGQKAVLQTMRLYPSTAVEFFDAKTKATALATKLLLRG